MTSRREFMSTLAGSTMLSISQFNLMSEDIKARTMGVTAASYMRRLFRGIDSGSFPPFESPIQFLRHCSSIGAGGIQYGIRNWDTNLARQLREAAEELDMYVEGQIGLPKDVNDLDRFVREVNTAGEAGIKLIRTVCLSGRRYETFETLEEFQEFKKNSYRSVELAEPVMKRAGIKLAIENHKDWRSDEFIDLITHIDSEFCGVCLDVGNNFALLEEAWEFAAKVAPYTINFHVKDMVLQQFKNGFLLSEVPLGEGIVDLNKIFNLVEKYNPDVTFGLEMITRDPLYIPCLERSYWSTFDKPIDASQMAQILLLASESQSLIEENIISSLSGEEQLRAEEENNVRSIRYAKKHLGFK